MDNVRKLRNLLQDCERKVDFKKYDENIKRYYSDDFKLALSKFNYDEGKIRLKKNITKSDYSTYREYIEHLQVLQTKCKYILENRISIANLNIPKSFYSGDVLLLDNINNVKVLIDILDTLDESDTIYHNIKGLDFEILTSHVKTSINHKNINIKRKYYKMNEEAIIHDVLSSYQVYYVAKKSFSSFLSLLEKKRAKHNIRQKKISSILENLLLNFLPALILTFISISATSFFAIVIFPLQNSFFDLQSIIEVIIKLVIFGVVIWVEAILSRELLNKFKLMRGVIGYWAFLIACFLNLAANIYPEHNLIVSILVTLSAIIYGFWCGPNFRHKPETPFSLLGRLLVSLTVMDFYFMVSKGSYGYGVVVAVLLLFSSMLPLQLKKIENSPWYSRREK